MEMRLDLGALRLPSSTQFTAMLTSGCDFYLLTLGLRAVLPRTAK